MYKNVVSIMAEKKKALKKLIDELNKGMDPDKAKKDFQAIISDTGPDELAKVEEELVKEGMPRERLNKLCDVHIAVFQEQLGDQKLMVPKGHPLAILMEEHRILLEYVEKLSTTTNSIATKKNFDSITDEIKVLADIAHHFKESIKHYLREENVLFPFIEKHGLTEPPAQMWIDHDKIRALEKQLYDLIEIAKMKSGKYVEFKDQLLKNVGMLANLITTHFYKENNILFPASMRLLTPEEWQTVREDFNDIGYCCFTPEDVIKAPMEKIERKVGGKLPEEGMIEFDTGPVPIAFIEPILNSLPIDMTFVDHEDNVMYFSKGEERIFVRTKAIIGRSVINCHPEKSYHVVKQILDDFRDGKRKVAEFWIDLQGKKIHIRYFAVHDKAGKYLGCLEVSQDITEIQKLEGQKRLLD
jgi:PAS domain S-box-containing protein